MDRSTAMSLRSAVGTRGTRSPRAGLGRLVTRTIRESTIVSHRTNVERAIDLMRSDVCAPLCLADLARTARMSEFHFTRVFHDSTGLPPFRFLSALRLARARDLLVNTD